MLFYLHMHDSIIEFFYPIIDFLAQSNTPPQGAGYLTLAAVAKVMQA